MQQDELAALFQQSLNFQTPAAEPEPVQQAQEQGHDIEIETHHQPIIYASTHYTPNTTHLSRTHSAPPNLATPPPPPSKDPALIALFARHAIDITALSPGQLTLFTGAATDPDQQLRLLELWRITLPAATDDGVWTTATNLEMEERLARERWERMNHRPAHINTTTAADMDMMTDDETSSPTSTLASPTGMPGTCGAEPYMMSGYEMLAKREYEGGSNQKATDPVYKAAVENQYGAFQAMREYGYESRGWFGGAAGDEEMVM